MKINSTLNHTTTAYTKRYLGCYVIICICTYEKITHILYNVHTGNDTHALACTCTHYYTYTIIIMTVSASDMSISVISALNYTFYTLSCWTQEWARGGERVLILSRENNSSMAVVSKQCEHTRIHRNWLDWESESEDFSVLSTCDCLTNLLNDITHKTLIISTKSEWTIRNRPKTSRVVYQHYHIIIMLLHLKKNKIKIKVTNIPSSWNRPTTLWGYTYVTCMFGFTLTCVFVWIECRSFYKSLPTFPCVFKGSHKLFKDLCSLLCFTLHRQEYAWLCSVVLTVFWKLDLPYIPNIHAPIKARNINFSQTTRVLNSWTKMGGEFTCTCTLLSSNAHVYQTEPISMLCSHFDKRTCWRVNVKRNNSSQFFCLLSHPSSSMLLSLGGSSFQDWMPWAWL